MSRRIALASGGILTGVIGSNSVRGARAFARAILRHRKGHRATAGRFSPHLSLQSV